MQTIFVFAYYSFKDPVFQSAVLPYLKSVKGEELRFVLLTWEQDEYQLDTKEKIFFKSQLLQDNIYWHYQKWHSGNFKFIKKAYDFILGLTLSTFLILKYKSNKIYSEGFPGAIIGHFLSKLTRLPHIVHTFEPHADYMFDAGVWAKTNWEYKLIKKMEIPIADHAESIITATHAYRNILEGITNKANIKVIPSCVGYSEYNYSVDKRKVIRSKLGLDDTDTMFIYLGKIGGMYMEDELFYFINHILKIHPKSFFFLGTNANIENLKVDLGKNDIDINRVMITFLSKDEVPWYLSASDIAFCGIRPIPSRRFSSPIKNGEYWASGLPIIIPEGISDDYLHIRTMEIGIVFKKICNIRQDDILRIKKLSRDKIIEKTKPLRSIESHENLFREILLAKKA